MKLPKDKKVIVERHNKVVYDCGDTVVKVFNGNKPAADILNEALNLARADQAGIDVPELVEVGKTGKNWAISTKKVKGKTLRQLINEDYDVERMADFVELELRIHAHKNPLMNRQKDKYRRMIESIPDIINEATRYELLVRLDGMPNHSKVCHGDFVPSNIIVRSDGSMCVCDWAHATQGNGGADCATTYLHLMLGGEKEIAEKYLRTYCERQGCDMAYIQNWMSIVAAAELARGRVVEQDYLLSMIDVVDYY
ncbi:MAG: aminoglycoside phosphotransferase family protein [Atopobiaceae bacterium]|nr:aminoglycoside phosphotransferase family protein [Atopobiaceae bacterium]